jgi:hypothetical protein
MSQAQDNLHNYLQHQTHPTLVDEQSKLHSSLNRRSFLAGAALLTLGAATAWNFFDDSKSKSGNSNSGNSVTNGSGSKDSIVIKGTEYSID